MTIAKPMAVARLLAVLILLLGATVTMRAQIPQTFKNLQVLPKDISRNDLTVMMKSFAQGLGVRCEHCHVGEGNDLTKFDFAADTKPAKATARRMIHMVNQLNDLVVGLKVSPDMPATKVPPQITCFTCHRGEKKPLTAPGGGGGMQFLGSSGPQVLRF